MAGEHIVIVDDDERLCRLVGRYLSRSGYTVSQCHSGAEMRAIAADSVDLFILDVMLDGEDGLQLAQEIRASSPLMPVMMLSARAELSDRVIGLELGADDYLTKPFEEVELLARVRSLLRRSQRGGNANSGVTPVARFSGWTLDRVGHVLTSPDGQVVDLTSFEYQVLALLVSKANTAVSREEILKLTNNREWTPFDRTVDVVVAKLRKKMETEGQPGLIKTIRNAGYELAAVIEYGK